MHRSKSWESFTRSFKAVPQADKLHDKHFYFFVMTVERNPSSFKHFIDRIRKKSFPKDDMEDCYDYGALSGEVRASRRCCMMNFSSPQAQRRGVRVRVCPSYTVSLWWRSGRLWTTLAIHGIFIAWICMNPEFTRFGQLCLIWQVWYCTVNSGIFGHSKGATATFHP